MTCERCHGLMVSEQIYDLQGMNSDLCVGGYRCLLCAIWSMRRFWKIDGVQSTRLEFSR